MKEPIKHIRQFLTHFTGKAAVAAESAKLTNGRLLKMVRQIADEVQPQLTPYQAALYWYLFRQTLVEGEPFIRVTQEGLRKGVIRPQRGATLSGSQVRRYLNELEALGAIRQEGESGRARIYRVNPPAELSRQGAAPLAARQTRVGSAELDFYNVRANRKKVYERDAYVCRYCGKQLTQLTVTLDHVMPVAEGGGNELENLVTACLRCNSSKKHRPVGDFLAER